MAVTDVVVAEEMAVDVMVEETEAVMVVGTEEATTADDKLKRSSLFN